MARQPAKRKGQSNASTETPLRLSELEPQVLDRIVESHPQLLTELLEQHRHWNRLPDTHKPYSALLSLVDTANKLTELPFYAAEQKENAKLTALHGEQTTIFDRMTRGEASVQDLTDYARLGRDIQATRGQFYRTLGDSGDPEKPLSNPLWVQHPELFAAPHLLMPEHETLITNILAAANLSDHPIRAAELQEATQALYKRLAKLPPAPATDGAAPSFAAPKAESLLRLVELQARKTQLEHINELISEQTEFLLAVKDYLKVHRKEFDARAGDFACKSIESAEEAYGRAGKLVGTLSHEIETQIQAKTHGRNRAGDDTPSGG